jgi:hypothetical protein
MQAKNCKPVALKRKGYRFEIQLHAECGGCEWVNRSCMSKGAKIWHSGIREGDKQEGSRQSVTKETTLQKKFHAFQ